MATVLGIDVGLHGLGCGLTADGEPVLGWYQPNHFSNKRDRSGWQELIDDMLRALDELEFGEPDFVVIEQMQQDRRTGGGAVVGDVLALQALVWYLAGHMSCLGYEVVVPTPSEWTDGIPKRVRINRLIKRLQGEHGLEDPRRDLLALPPGYSYTGGRSHDVLDGVALSLWFADRLSGRRPRRRLADGSR